MKSVQRFFSLMCLIVLFSIAAKADDLRGDTIDIYSYVLRMDFTDFGGGIMKGNASMLIKAKMDNVSSIRLDLLRLTIDSVKVSNWTPVYTYNDTVLSVNLLTTLNTGDSLTIAVYYHGHPLQISNDFGGFYWTANAAFNIGVSFLSNPHNFGKCWFPCFDNFHARSYHESYITTPVGMKALSNGLLLDTAQNTNSTTWHWKLAESIPSYLVSVTVAAFKTISDTLHGINGTIPVTLEVLDSVDSGYCLQQFAHLHEVFHNLEKYWGPYRWEKVGYCMVPFDAGAMEHATNISFSQYFIDPAVPQFFDIAPQIVAHELSHHWFGDLVTCDSAQEMWLNEGWARYNEMLYFEYTYGRDSALIQWRQNHFNVVQMANISDKGYWALSKVPQAETYGTTTYNKGADAIHTLRYIMGDTLFFYGVQNYLNGSAWGNGSSTGLMYWLSLIADLNLTPFFNNWILDPGFTHLSVEGSNVQPAGNGTYTVNCQIRQRLKHAPNYYSNLPVQISYFAADRSHTIQTVIVNGECTFAATTLPYVPVYIAVDFDEQIQDAISDEWKILGDTGSYTFDIGLMNLHVNSLSDSVLFRIEHNWIPADAMYNPVQGLHLDSHRYWTVGGVFDSTFKADGTIEYSGIKTDYLDSNFISNNGDSIVMMYRPKQDTDWAFADSFQVTSSGARGTVTIYNIKQGEYALGIYDHRLATDTNTRIPCYLETAINQPGAPQGFNMYPNPTAETVTITFNNNIFNRLEMTDLTGRKIREQKILPGQGSVELKLKDIMAGTYLVTLTGASGSTNTQKLIKQ